MPPPNRSFDNVASLPALKLRRAELAANLPTDDEFEALLVAQADAQRAARAQQQSNLAALEAEIDKAQSEG